jgi:hypothetical protein
MTRRDFLGRLGAVCAAAAAPAVLAACVEERTEAGSGVAGAVVVDASTCSGYADLGPDQRRMRESFGYVDAAPTPTATCNGCRFFTTPEAAAPCGGCSLFHGPVSPGGWCRSWAPTVTA